MSEWGTTSGRRREWRGRRSSGAKVLLGRTLGLTLGVFSWFETASDNAKSSARTDTVRFRDENTRPLAQATPAYRLANGPQWFLGPYLGLCFGP